MKSIEPTMTPLDYANTEIRRLEGTIVGLWLAVVVLTVSFLGLVWFMAFNEGAQSVHAPVTTMEKAR